VARPRCLEAFDVHGGWHPSDGKGRGRDRRCRGPRGSGRGDHTERARFVMVWASRAVRSCTPGRAPRGNTRAKRVLGSVPGRLDGRSHGPTSRQENFERLGSLGSATAFSARHVTTPGGDSRRDNPTECRRRRSPAASPIAFPAVFFRMGLAFSMQDDLKNASAAFGKWAWVGRPGCFYWTGPTRAS